MHRVNYAAICCTNEVLTVQCEIFAVRLPFFLMYIFEKALLNFKCLIPYTKN